MYIFQEGYGTPGVTGYLEVEVAGKLVHSKKVKVLNVVTLNLQNFTSWTSFNFRDNLL